MPCTPKFGVHATLNEKLHYAAAQEAANCLQLNRLLPLRQGGKGHAKARVHGSRERRTPQCAGFSAACSGGHFAHTNSEVVFPQPKMSWKSDLWAPTTGRAPNAHHVRRSRWGRRQRPMNGGVMSTARLMEAGEILVQIRANKPHVWAQMGRAQIAKAIAAVSDQWPQHQGGRLQADAPTSAYVSVRTSTNY